MIKAAVLGSPIAHSLSPLLHKKAYEFLGLPASYEAIELLPADADDFFKNALRERWTGFSLTMPLKECIFNSGFLIDPVASRMRSANTLVLQDDNYFAVSTDRTGFMRLFNGVKKERVAIIGGGGTARAALGALDGLSEQIDFLLQTPSRADVLRQVAITSSLNFYDMNHSLDDYDLIISTVPAGAGDHLASRLTSADMTVCEVLYKPYPTIFLAQAQSIGARTIDGFDLLVEQALDQISLFSGLSFDQDAMRDLLIRTSREFLS